MTKPLVILENHFDSSARIFLTENISDLKSKGYSTFLWEMNSEQSLNF